MDIVMPMTVSEIADRVVKQGPSREMFIERVHYWTRERLISPIGKRNPGTGKHRRYASSVVQDTVILNAMADVGIPIAKQHEIMKVVRRDLEQRMQPWAKERPDLHLVIEKFTGLPQYKINFHDGPYTTHPDAEITIVFNLTRLFSVLQNETGRTNG
jgi:DNA-binding transcriptional MerR regulator